MSLDKLIVFQGKGTMTGEATDKKFPGVEYDAGDSFDAILDKLREENVLAVLPLWNSHLGEIKKTKIIECLFKEGFQLHAIWPNWIDFACIVKKGTKETDIKKIISYFVAGVQCSDFIRVIGADFDDNSKSTKDAHRRFTEEGRWDAVLCRPELCNETQEILLSNVSNRLNFTTFVLVGKVPEDEWTDLKWDRLKTYICPKNYQLSGIEMPAIEGSLSEDQHDLFEYFLEGASQIDEIPKIIFASENDYGQLRIILEYKKSPYQHRFPDVGIMSDIEIIDDIGTTNLFYSEEVKRFIPSRYPFVPNKHFVKHLGEKTCFYSCPPLNIFVHGFDTEITELIARESIVNHFKALEKGVERTEIQNDFFEEYEADYREYGVDFPSFEEL